MSLSLIASLAKGTTLTRSSSPPGHFCNRALGNSDLEVCACVPFLMSLTAHTARMCHSSGSVTYAMEKKFHQWNKVQIVASCHVCAQRNDEVDSPLGRIAGHMWRCSTICHPFNFTFENTFLPFVYIASHKPCLSTSSVGGKRQSCTRHVLTKLDACWRRGILMFVTGVPCFVPGLWSRQ